MNGSIAIGLLVALLFFGNQWNIERRLKSIELRLNALLRHVGAVPPLKVPVSEKVKGLATEPGKRLEAIKALREETGLGLKEAKDLIEQLETGLYSDHA